MLSKNQPPRKSGAADSELYGRLLVGVFLNSGGQEAYKLAVAVHGDASLFYKAHAGVVIIGIGFPAGHRSAVSVGAVGVAGLDEVAPVVAHLAG